jgi:hypothetical protein
VNFPFWKDSKCDLNKKLDKYEIKKHDMIKDSASFHNIPLDIYNAIVQQELYQKGQMSLRSVSRVGMPINMYSIVVGCFCLDFQHVYS